MAQHDPFVGLVIEEQYLLQDLLARSAARMLFQAEELSTSSPVFVHLVPLQSESPDNQAKIEKSFMDIAKQVHAVTHPNVIDLHDYGIYRGMGFLVYRPLEGETFREYLQRNAPLSPTEAADFVDQLSDAVSAGHDVGVVHGDLCPENIILVRSFDGSVQPHVAEFGLAQLLSCREEIEASASPSITGRPQYMSPEKIQGTAITPVSDVYSLGILAYEMLTGKVPFAPESNSPEALMEVLMRQASEDPRPIRSISPELPIELDEVVLQALEKQPHKRPKEARAFSRLVSQASVGLGPSFAPPPSASIPQPSSIETPVFKVTPQSNSPLTVREERDRKATVALSNRNREEAIRANHPHVDAGTATLGRQSPIREPLINDESFRPASNPPVAELLPSAEDKPPFQPISGRQTSHSEPLDRYEQPVRHDQLPRFDQSPSQLDADEPETSLFGTIPDIEPPVAEVKPTASQRISVPVDEEPLAQTLRSGSHTSLASKMLDKLFEDSALGDEDSEDFPLPQADKSTKPLPGISIPDIRAEQDISIDSEPGFDLDDSSIAGLDEEVSSHDVLGSGGFKNKGRKKLAILLAPLAGGILLAGGVILYLAIAPKKIAKAPPIDSPASESPETTPPPEESPSGEQQQPSDATSASGDVAPPVDEPEQVEPVQVEPEQAQRPPVKLTKVGIVDLEKILLQSVAGKKVMDVYQKHFASLKGDPDAEALKAQLRQQNRALVSELLVKIRSIIRDYGKSEGYAMIVSGDGDISKGPFIDESISDPVGMFTETQLKTNLNSVIVHLFDQEFTQQ